MVVVRLMGGLGNQMFQYATGRRLSVDRGVPLKLDLSWFSERENADTRRDYELGGWRIRAEIASKDELAVFATLPQNRLMRAWRRLWPDKFQTVREAGTGFQPAVVSAKTPVYLIGYWQNEDYFKPIAKIICDDFQPSGQPCAHASRLANSASRRSTIAVHVRRGDYVHNAMTNAFHGTCSIDYYNEASEIARQNLTEPLFLVFSDDLDWVRKNLSFPGDTHFVEHDGKCSPHHDIWLMSRCLRHVIANSSFSWWGAWLCNRDEKMVIAPRRWFRDVSHDSRDIVPSDWILIGRS